MKNSQKTRYFERGLSKNLKKINPIFLSNPVLFDGQDYEKQKGPRTSEHSFFRLQNRFQILPEQVWWCIIKQYLSYSKNYICQFMEANSWHPIIPLSFVLLNLKRLEKKGKNYKNLNVSRTKRAFSMKLKAFLTVFEGYSLGKNTKHLGPFCAEMWVHFRWKLAKTRIIHFTPNSDFPENKVLNSHSLLKH